MDEWVWARARAGGRFEADEADVDRGGGGREGDGQELGGRGEREGEGGGGCDGCDGCDGVIQTVGIWDRGGSGWDWGTGWVRSGQVRMEEDGPEWLRWPLCRAVLGSSRAKVEKK